MIVYISGPITGIKNNNAFEFCKMEKELERTFYNLAYLKIVNPIRLSKQVEIFFDEQSKILGTKKAPKWEDYMRVCIAELANCTHVIVLENYKNQRGCGLNCLLQRCWASPFFSI